MRKALQSPAAPDKRPVAPASATNGESANATHAPKATRANVESRIAFATKGDDLLAVSANALRPARAVGIWETAAGAEPLRAHAAAEGKVADAASPANTAGDTDAAARVLSKRSSGPQRLPGECDRQQTGEEDGGDGHHVGLLRSDAVCGGLLSAVAGFWIASRFDGRGLFEVFGSRPRAGFRAVFETEMCSRSGPSHSL